MEAQTMKGSFVPIAVLLLFATLSRAQDFRQEPTQNPDASYRLFNTRNVYTLLKLDTRDGRIWQVQWGDKDHRFIEALNLDSLASNGKPGRFTLYPTSNIYTFILLDQETGDAWHVQWGRLAERFLLPIRELAED
jgi:hypothetical protein